MTGDDDRQQIVEALKQDLRRIARGGGFDVAKARRDGPLRRLGFRKVNPKPKEDGVVEGLRLALEAACELLRHREVTVGGERTPGYPAEVIVEGVLRIGAFANNRDNLLQRRQAVADEIGLKDGATIAKWESSALEELAYVLVEASEAPERLSSELKPAIKDQSQEIQPGMSAVRVWQSAHYSFDSAGRITEREVKITLRSIEAVTGSFEFWHEYFDDHRPGVFTVASCRNCILSRQGHVGGAHFAEFDFMPPILLNEERTISYRLSIATDIRAAPRIRSSAVETMDDRRCIISLQFDQTYRPEQVWWFVEAGNRGAQFAPQAESMLEVEQSGYVEHPFPSLSFGADFGLAWRWPEIALE